jgi:hypothetical protein
MSSTTIGLGGLVLLGVLMSLTLSPTLVVQSSRSNQAVPVHLIPNDALLKFGTTAITPNFSIFTS